MFSAEIKYVPQPAATTFAFFSVFILFISCTVYSTVQCTLSVQHTLAEIKDTLHRLLFLELLTEF